MERMRKRARLLNEMRTGEDLWKERTYIPKVRRQPNPESLKALRSEDQPVPISLGTRRWIITFVVIMGAALLLLLVARVFLD